MENQSYLCFCTRKDGGLRKKQIQSNLGVRIGLQLATLPTMHEDEGTHKALSSCFKTNKRKWTSGFLVLFLHTVHNWTVKLINTGWFSEAKYLTKVQRSIWQAQGREEKSTTGYKARWSRHSLEKIQFLTAGSWKNATEERLLCISAFPFMLS